MSNEEKSNRSRREEAPGQTPEDADVRNSPPGSRRAEAPGQQNRPAKEAEDLAEAEEAIETEGDDS